MRKRHGPATPCYNSFVRWRKPGYLGSINEVHCLALGLAAGCCLSISIRGKTSDEVVSGGVGDLGWAMLATTAHAVTFVNLIASSPPARSSRMPTPLLTSAKWIGLP